MPRQTAAQKKEAEAARLKSIHRNDRMVPHDSVEEGVLIWQGNVRGSNFPHYWSDQWQRCHGEDTDARPEPDHARRYGADFKCAGCSMQFLASEMTEGKPSYNTGSGMFPPPHLRRLTVEDHCREQMIAAIKALGLDPFSESLREAVWATRDSERRVDQTHLSRIAHAVTTLGVILTRQAAVEQTAEALTAMSKIKVGDEFLGFPEEAKRYYEEGDEDAPFFTESFLYNLLGKEAARTILAVFHQAQRAAGA
jgi:hypothetical protein